MIQIIELLWHLVGWQPTWMMASVKVVQPNLTWLLGFPSLTVRVALSISTPFLMVIYLYLLSPSFKAPMLRTFETINTLLKLLVDII